MPQKPVCTPRKFKTQPKTHTYLKKLSDVHEIVVVVVELLAAVVELVDALLQLPTDVVSIERTEIPEQLPQLLEAPPENLVHHVPQVRVGLTPVRLMYVAAIEALRDLLAERADLQS